VATTSSSLLQNVAKIFFCDRTGESDRERINAIIFGELVNGDFSDSSRLYFNEVIEKLKNFGCDAVALACTEIPLIVRPEEALLPTLDSTRLLARAALKEALE
jgi:aspartate racemase